MKFGKSLSNQIEEALPEWRDKFLSYKELKKRLKLIEPKPQAQADAGEEARPSKRLKSEVGMSAAEADFVKLLEDELEKFNSFFVEKEEEYIIRLKDLQDQVEKAKDFNGKMIKIRREIVDFHGEMVLLENYSALNYTGLVKILKKYDKRTGALLRLPFIQKVLQEPFFTTDLLYKLVKECETMLERALPEKITIATVTSIGNESPTTSDTRDEDGNVGIAKELSEIEYMESLYMKSTISALKTLKEIRSGSSTVSVFSLPPLQISGLEDSCKTAPALEQLAK